MPRVAIVDSNTLAVIGLRQLLQGALPMMGIDGFGSFAELESSHPEQYYHYFVAMDIVLAHRSFFVEHRRKTIVLTLSLSDASQLSGFHSLCINQPEQGLVHQLLSLHSKGHGSAHNMPPEMQQKVLTDREIEVMSLIVRGLINKEIAERLHIGLSTVITHRKHIMDKLGMRSVSALTVYAVMHGYVDINSIHNA